MNTFYYLAVNGADSRRMNGQIDAASEELARTELNRMGLSVLGIGTEPIATGATATVTFEFEAADKTGKFVSGTIDAEDRVAALERLTTEFAFVVKYLCVADATEADKRAAREVGIAPVVAEKDARSKKSDAQKRMSLTGSITDLVRRAEEKMKQPSAARTVAIGAKESTDTYADTSSPSVATPTAAASTNDTIEVEVPTFAPVADDKVSVDEPTKDTSWNRMYLLINELILPPADTSRAEVMDEMRVFLRQKMLAYGLIAHPDAPRASHTAQLWHFVTTLSGTLAAVFVGYTLFAMLASRYEWGGVSEMARSAVVHSTLIPYLALVFLVWHIVLRARDVFATQQAVRTALLFSVTSVVLVFVGLNVVY